MTVVVTNDHTEFWDATSSPLFDGNVWGSGDGASSIFFVEGTQSMNAQNKGTGRGGMGFNKGITNITGMHLHTWVNTLDLPSSNATGGWAIRFSSSATWNSNYASFNAGGLDTSRLIVKRFQPFVVDPSQTPDRSASPPALTAVTCMWAESDVTTNSGQKTVFVDRMFYGSHSRFRGGTTAGAAGTSAQAALETPAVPIFIKADGVYHILDGIEIGDDTSATSQYWEDGNETWVFADQNVATDFYRVELRGHATGTHSRIIGTKSGTGIDATGSGGYTFVAGGAAPFHFISTDSNLDVAGMYGCIWNNAGHEDGTFELTTGEHIGHSFSGMGQLTLDCGATGATFTRCGLADSVTAATGLEQAAINLGTTKPATNAFRYVTVSGASRYGLRVEGTSTVGDEWDLDDIVVADSPTADVLVDYPAQTGGNKVTLNLLGTSALSSTTQIAVTGGIALADVVVASSVPITVTVLDHDSAPYEGASVYIKLVSGDGGAVVLNAVTNASGVASASYTGSTPVTIDTDISEVRSSSGPIPYSNYILSGDITSSGYTQTALLRED